MRYRSIRLLALPFIGIAALALGACGSGNDGDETARNAPSSAEFPSAKGKRLEEIRSSLPEAELVVSPAASVFEVGKNRFPLGVFELDATQVDDADVALYFAKNENSRVIGPLPARVDSLETKPAFLSLIHI